METKFTKVKWFTYRRTDQHKAEYIVTENQETICDLSHFNYEQSEANAKLIASAPEMFMAISDFVQTSNEQGVLNVDYYKELFTEILTKIIE